MVLKIVEQRLRYYKHISCLGAKMTKIWWYQSRINGRIHRFLTPNWLEFILLADEYHHHSFFVEYFIKGCWFVDFWWFYSSLRDCTFFSIILTISVDFGRFMSGSIDNDFQKKCKRHVLSLFWYLDLFRKYSWFSYISPNFTHKL